MSILFIFLIGISIGSFLNVLIDRLPHDESFVKGRSYCDSCKKQLAWYDLMPILSFVLLRGQCRYCHSPISIQYPVVELLTGALFVFTVILFPEQNVKCQMSNVKCFAGILFNLYIVSSLIVIFFTDLKYGIIPDKIVYPGSAFSIIYILLTIPYSLVVNMLSAVGAFLLFFLLHIVTRGRGMGLGDVKLAGLLGLFLGFPKIIVALYVAFLTGAAVSLILVLLGKKKLKGSTVPFGPFMVLGTMLAFFYGDTLISYIF